MNTTYNKISKIDFLKLNEDDLLFITNPGRMGDEDGSTFIIKKNNVFTIYRVDGFMYQKGEISIKDAFKQFPKWHESWEHSKDNYKGKYKYLYMGFGNGLCVDNSIYSEYKPYLDTLVKKYLDEHNNDDSLKYAALCNLWENAFINMANDKRYIIK